MQQSRFNPFLTSQTKFTRTETLIVSYLFKTASKYPYIKLLAPPLSDGTFSISLRINNLIQTISQVSNIDIINSGSNYIVDYDERSVSNRNNSGIIIFSNSINGLSPIGAVVTVTYSYYGDTITANLEYANTTFRGEIRAVNFGYINSSGVQQKILPNGTAWNTIDDVRTYVNNNIAGWKLYEPSRDVQLAFISYNSTSPSIRVGIIDNGDTLTFRTENVPEHSQFHSGGRTLDSGLHTHEGDTTTASVLEITLSSGGVLLQGTGSQFFSDYYVNGENDGLHSHFINPNTLIFPTTQKNNVRYIFIFLLKS